MMPSRQLHPSDEQLLRFAELELNVREANLARAHLSACQACSHRLQELEATLTDVIAEHQAQLSARHSATLRSRNRLAVSLRAEKAAAPAPPRRVHLRMFAAAAIATVLIMATSRFAHIWSDYPLGFHTSQVENLPLPSRTLTPGSLRTVRREDVCQDAELENDPPVNATTEEAVFREYAVPAASRSNYAMDYLVAPSLGGALNASNIWPEPASSAWNAADKDRLEDYLHQLVCAGQLPLDTAQSELATDWIAAYKKYFHTDRPRAAAPGTERAGFAISMQLLSASGPPVRHSPTANTGRAM